MRLPYTLIILGLVALGVLRTLFSVIMATNDGGLTPTIYKIGDPVELIVNKVESDVTQLPYAYYDLPFTCPPTMHKKPLHLSLNEIIRGDRKWQSDYKLAFNRDDECSVLCARKTSKEGVESLKDLIQKGYVVQWLIDQDLPAATTFISTTDQKKYYASGFPLGFIDEDTGKIYVNNHVMLVIRFHAIDDYNFTIVGFEVYPKSVSDYHCPGASKDYDQYEVVIPEDSNELTFIPFTYSVYWREEFDIDWKHRYEMFFHNGELSNEVSSKFHWISLANSVGIAFLMTFIVYLILTKIKKTDENGYDDIYNDSSVLMEKNNLTREDQTKNSIFATARSWYHNDRSPLPHIFIFLISMGVQFLFTIVGSLTISCSLNKLHNIRHTVLSMALVFFILGAFMASYVGTYLALENNKLVSRRGSLKNLVVNSTIFPIVCGSLLPLLVMIITIALNSIIWAHDSTNALPFGTIVKLVTLYFIVCIPLSILGGSLAQRSNQKDYARLRSDSVKKNAFDIRKSFDHNASHLTSAHGLKALRNKIMFHLRRFAFDSFTLMVILGCGIFPFIIIYVELQYVYKSVWLEKTTFYYLYGFLLANIILLCFVICEIAIISAYLMMTISQENFARTWRWKSFQISSSCAWYMEFFSLYYVFKVLNIRGFSSIFISICYSLLFNTLCGLAMGSLGYLVTLIFVRRIYKMRYQN
ncbi:transmembrane 9 superfamily member 3 [Monosporozyma unispora]